MHNLLLNYTYKPHHLLLLLIVTNIASKWYALSYSPVEGWITTERKFYEVYDSTGYFLGYYKVLFKFAFSNA